MKSYDTKAALLFFILFKVFFLTSAFNANAQAITFQKAYGTQDSTSDASGSCIQGTFDGGFIATGYISNFGAGDDDYYLVKADQSGNIVWAKTYGDVDADDASYVIQTSDSGYAIIGTSLSYGGTNMLLIKTDASGNMSWAKTYGNDDAQADASASSIKQTADGGFIIAGYIGDYGGGGHDVFLIKINANGSDEWTKTFGGAGEDFATDVALTSDGGYIITGLTKSFNDPTGDIYLVKTDANGDLEWAKDYGDPGSGPFDMGNSVQQTTDHGYVIAGVMQSTLWGENAILVKTDSTGVIQWTKAYGTNNASSDASASSVQQTADGGYIFTGYISNFGAGGDDFYLVKTNATGDTLWTKTFGSSEDDDANFVRETGNLTYLVTGVTHGFQASGLGEHLYVVKVSGSGYTFCPGYNTGTTINANITFAAYSTSTLQSSGGVTNTVSPSVSNGGVATLLCENIGIQELSGTPLAVNVYPNPFSDKATVTLNSSSPNLQHSVFVMYDVMGKEVVSMNIPDGNFFTIERGNLPDNIYFYTIVKNSQTIFSGKLTIAH